ncbi:MAG: FkbM family methyltransferase [Pseudomonadota bacterium]
MQDKNSLLSRLAQLEARQSGGRARRLLRQPFRSLWPLALRRFNGMKEVEVETFFGSTFRGVLPEAVTTQVWRSRYYSPEVCRALIHTLKPGDTFMDIGGHFGFFSLLGASLVGATGHVLTVEAMPSTFGQLKKNIGPIAAQGQATLINSAAFDQNITLEFKDFGIVASSLNTAFENRGDPRMIKSVAQIEVQARITDEIVAEAGIKAPSLIKIDAESAELQVLNGLKQTIEAHKPALIIELGDGPEEERAQSSKIVSLLEGYGYSAHVFVGEEKRPFRLEGSIAYANVLFS